MKIKIALIFASILLIPNGFTQEDDHFYTVESIQTGFRVYTQQCALCHGPQGDRVDGVNLSIGQFRNVRSDEDIQQVIINGLSGGRMPRNNLSSAELSGIVAYIRAGFDPLGEAVKVGDANRGKLIFEGKGNCSSCHRVNGMGPRSAPDLSSIGIRLSPSKLQLNIIDPASALMPINRAIRIVTISEETITGRRLNEDTYSVQLIDSNGQLRSIQKSNIATYNISNTPSKGPSDLNPEEVADLVGYLLTLRGL
jgi:putative heme-binding domain-containing protein